MGFQNVLIQITKRIESVEFFSYKKNKKIRTLCRYCEMNSAAATAEGKEGRGVPSPPGSSTDATSGMLISR